MNLLMKRTSIFAMIVIMISLTFMSAFAAETKEEETNYGNWVEVADAMSEHLQKAVEVYKPGDKDAKKQPQMQLMLLTLNSMKKLDLKKQLCLQFQAKGVQWLNINFTEQKNLSKKMQTQKKLKMKLMHL